MQRILFAIAVAFALICGPIAPTPAQQVALAKIEVLASGKVATAGGFPKVAQFIPPPFLTGKINKARAFIGQNVNAGTGAGVTFTNAIPGVAYARYVLVFVGGYQNAGGTTTSITIQGVAATKHLDQANGNDIQAAATAFIPAGTATGDIVGVFSASHNAYSYVAYEITGIASVTPVGTGSTTSNNTGVTTTTIAGGFLFGASAVNSSGTNTWTNITKDSDNNDGNHSWSAASIATAGASVTATNNNSAAAGVVQYVSY